MKTCGNCKFSHGPEPHCRRQPPMPYEGGQRSAFPPVNPQWAACGEWRRRMDLWRRKLKQLGYVPAGSFVPPPDDVASCAPMSGG